MGGLYTYILNCLYLLLDIYCYLFVSMKNRQYYAQNICLSWLWVTYNYIISTPTVVCVSNICDIYTELVAAVCL